MIRPQTERGLDASRPPPDPRTAPPPADPRNRGLEFAQHSSSNFSVARVWATEPRSLQ